MPLIFHEIGHNADGVAAGASIDVFLEDGLVSKALLRASGKLPPSESPYDRAVKLSLSMKELALQRREEWRHQQRQEALKDSPDVLKSVLDEDKESTWWREDGAVSGYDLFYKPGFQGHREENVFFGYAAHPSSDKDWVAIEVPDTVTLHDASCRDRGVPADWARTAVTIRQFQEAQGRGQLPRGWESKYNEYLIRDRVPAAQIVAYAKVEKELPIELPKLTGEQQLNVQDFISNQLGFATQFKDSRDNVLFSESGGGCQIRVAFNKERIAGREQVVKNFFAQFDSMGQLLEKAQEFAIAREAKESKLPPSQAVGAAAAASPEASQKIGANIQATQQTALELAANAKKAVVKKDGGSCVTM